MLISMYLTGHFKGLLVQAIRYANGGMAEQVDRRFNGFNETLPLCQ
jgi:hypothetical protein